MTFGHACYFGVGAYAVALGIHYAGISFALALLLAPIAAGLFALVFGWLSVRVSGVYFAMLTFALAQIVWSIIFQWYNVTGGDNGIVGLSSSGLSPLTFYFITLGLSAASVAILGWIPHSALGYALRVTRDSPARAAAIGINVRSIRLVAFIISGGLPALPGGLSAFAKGSVFPTAISIGRSIDGLVMVLLGGCAVNRRAGRRRDDVLPDAIGNSPLHRPMAPGAWRIDHPDRAGFPKGNRGLDR